MNVIEDQDWLVLLPDLMKQTLGPVKGELAADLWQRRYAHQGGSTIIEFMRVAAKEFELSGTQRNALRSAIHRARAGLLEPEPDNAEHLAAGRQVARRLLSAMRKAILEDHTRIRSEFTQALGREVAPHKGLHEMAAPVLGWMVQGGAMPELSLQDLQRVVHATYVSTCKVLGPVQADAILHQASVIASQIPEARRYPPTSLLYPER